MKILAYQGTGAFGHLIRWQAHVPHGKAYSHNSIMLRDGSIVEALEGHGVIHNPPDDAFHFHKKGTLVHVYEFVRPWEFDEAKANLWLMEQVGKKYDWWSVLKFVSKRQAKANDTWFCSELALSWASKGNIPLLNLRADYNSPTMTTLSTEIKQTYEFRVA